MSTLWTPAEIDTALWLDAADSSTITLVSGAVSEWRDKSGNGRHVSQSTSSRRPELVSEGLNGLDIVRFDNDCLLRAGFVPNDFTCIFVAKKRDLDNIEIGVMSQNNRTDNAGRLLIYVERNFNDVALGLQVGTATFPSGGRTGAFNIYSYTRTGTTGVGWKNGGGSSSLTVSSNAIQNTNFAIGSGTNVNTNFVDVDFAEALFISGVAADSDIRKVEGYFAWKWGLEDDLPSDHPYKDAAPTLPDPTSPTSTTTGTGTGTTSTGPAARLTPLNLMLVTMRLPDEAVEDEVPEEADAGIFGGDFVVAYDLTGTEPDSRFQDIAGTQPSTDRIGRARDLSGNGLDIAALNDAGRPKAGAGFGLYDSYNNHRLASAVFDETGADTYVAIRFTTDSFNNPNGNHLIPRGADSSGDYVLGYRGDDAFEVMLFSGTTLSAVSVGSGDHIVEVWAGSPARYALDGGPILESARNWPDGLQRIVIGGRNIDISNRSWLGRIYRVLVRTPHPTEAERAAILNWLNNV